MRTFFTALFLIIILVSVVYFKIFDWNQLDHNTKWVAIQYERPNCQPCQRLEQKMHKIRWWFAQKPIVFIRYDRSQASNLTQLKRSGFWQIATQDTSQAALVIYHRFSKKTALKLSSGLDWEVMQMKIDSLIGNTF